MPPRAETMDPPQVAGHTLRDVVVGVVVIVVATVLVAYANLPTEVAVLKSESATTKTTIASMDAKLDKILERLPR